MAPEQELRMRCLEAAISHLNVQAGRDGGFSAGEAMKLARMYEEHVRGSTREQEAAYWADRGLVPAFGEFSPGQESN